jgi:DNA-binding transcriptional LysR family regulator
MRRGDLADLTAFVAIADNLSFRAAATRLGVTPSALSHTMRQLEDRVGVRLLRRTTRSVSLTDAGLRLLGRLRPAIDQVAGALEDLNQERRRPFARLRIHATQIAAAVVISPVWKRFLSTYPDVHIEVCVDDAIVDLVARGPEAGAAHADVVDIDTDRLEDLFGADRMRRSARMDRAGLAWFIGEGEVSAITAETATIQKPCSARQTFYLRPGDVKRGQARDCRRLRRHSSIDAISPSACVTLRIRDRPHFDSAPHDRLGQGQSFPPTWQKLRKRSSCTTSETS